MFVVWVYFFLLAVLSLYGLHRLWMTGVYALRRAQRPVAPQLDVVPKVTVQLPVYNEAAVVARLIDAVCALDWPRESLQIQVLDDSTDGSLWVSRAAARKWRDQGVDITVLHREDRAGFKAGALAAGLSSATGAFVAIFDADFVPPPDFLRVLVPHFGRSEDVGMVQARWGHLNEHQGLLTRLQAVLLDGHFVVEHTVRHRSGRFFNFNGTAGIWRASCIRDAGGWQHDTLTEDLDLSYRAQMAGWKFVYLDQYVVPAELPASISAFRTQQHRWAKGTVQTARKLLPGLLRSALPWQVKLEAAVHMTSTFAYGLLLLLALVLPLAMVVRGWGESVWAGWVDLPAFVASGGSIVLFYGVAVSDARAHGWLRLVRIPAVMALGVGMAVNQSRAIWEGWTGTDVTFVRTPKDGSVDGAQGVADVHRSAGSWVPWVEVGFAAYFLAATAYAWAHKGWASVPFLLLFATGFGGLGVGSLVRRWWPFSMALGQSAQKPGCPEPGPVAPQ